MLFVVTSSGMRKNGEERGARAPQQARVGGRPARRTAGIAFEGLMQPGRARRRLSAIRNPSQAFAQLYNAAPPAESCAKPSVERGDAPSAEQVGRDQRQGARP